MPREYQLQFGIASVLILTLGVAILCVSPRFFVDGIHALFQKTVVLSDTNWRYEARVEIAGGVNVIESKITWNSKPVPATLMTEGVTLKTPIGSFSPLGGRWYPHHTEPAWWSDKYKVPTIENTGRWVQQIDHKYPITEILENGVFEVPVGGTTLRGSWADRQLKGMPSHWIYVSKETANSIQAFWMDPERLDEFRFE